MQLLQSAVNWFLVCSAVVMLSAWTAPADSGIQGAVRGRRDADESSFWKRSPAADHTINELPASFWKRRSFHDPTNESEFWKRGVHSSDLGSSFAWKFDDGTPPKSSSRFWKRLNAIDDNDVIEESFEKRFDDAVGDSLTKQRRGDKSSQRRPEFNPTGW